MPITPPSQAAKPRVLVFDSGVGGLSICREIITSSPDIELDYLSDNAFFPYGEKTPEQLINRASQLLADCYQQLKPDIIVIACNTASTVVLPSLREQLDCPIVGVVPAIKSAAQLSQSKTFGLLATPGTVKRRYTQDLIQQYASDCKVLSVGSSELVKHIEAHIHGAAIDTHYIASIVAQLSEQDTHQAIDTVVLGCTHFPLIADHFKAIQPHWQWIDSAYAIASRIKSILAERQRHEQINNQASNSESHRPHNFWLTAKSGTNQNSQTDSLNRYLAELGFSAAKLLA